MNPTFLRRIAIALLLLLLAIAPFWWLTRSGTRQSPNLGNSESAESASAPGNAEVRKPTTENHPEQVIAGTSETPTAPSTPQHTQPAASVSMPVANQAGGDEDEPVVSTRTEAAGGKTVADIIEGADMTDPDTRARVVAEIKALEQRQQDAVNAKANALGIPLRKDGPENKVSTLYDIRGDQPLYRTTLNANAAISTGANLLVPAPYNLTGSGIRAGVWDGGSVRDTHQEFSGRVLKLDTAANDDHATHVAGTIAADGDQPAARGMAPGSLIDSYDWDSDYSEMTAAGAATAGDTSRIPLSNHSYGFDGLVTSDMGRYETNARDVDALAKGLPYYLIFWAAGNEQDTLTANNGFQSITFNGLAKNIMTIGAVDDAVQLGQRDPDAGVITYFSSLGPCDDGRVKPDLVANGTNLYSSVATNDSAYDGTYSGTSMATPNAMGSAILLEQLYAREFSGQRMRASMLKALMIHTATDIDDPGPDYTYGWGLIDVKSAADVILAHKASLAAPKMIEGTLTNANKTATHTFTWDGVSPIRASLCWTDPAGTAQTAANSRTANLKHNLDAKITAPDNATIYQPYVMPFVGTWSLASMSLPATTGKNNVDNIEQVFLAAPTQPGTYTVTVSLDGTLTTANQDYSLVITGGINVASNPPPDVALTAPADGLAILAGQSLTVSATATDLALGGGPGIVSQVEFFQGATSIGIDNSAPYSISWTPPAAGIFSITAVATDSAGASATSPAATITALTGDGIPVIASFAPGSGTVGTTVVLSGSNFAAVSTVKFNGTDAAFTVDSVGQITTTVPALATTGTITVANPFGTGTSATPFTVLVSPVLISQIYGAGGNSGASYRQDYVELYNRSDSPVSLAGWTVQYASSTGSTWQAAALSGTLAAGKYYLVGLDTGTSGAVLPAVDAANTNIALSATRGKVALMNTATVLAASSPAGNPALQDFVGYGTANAFEGAPAPAPSTTTAIFRAGSGATDTANNAADFATGTPLPRNSAYVLPGVPVITSAASATGTVGSLFSYQITASNSPASFNATGLPGGLTVNTSTGAITGTPTAAGSSSVTVSATNVSGTGSATLVLTINPSGGGGPATLIAGWDFQTTTTGGTAAAAAPNSPTVYSANFGTGTLYLNGTNGASTWVTATSGNETSSFGGTAVNAGSGFSTVTSGASSLTVLNSTANIKSMVFKFSMTGLKDLIASYATQNSGTGFTSHKWEYGTDGVNWTTVQTLTPLPTSYAVRTLTTITGLDGTANAYLRLTVNGATSAAGNNRLDNIQLNATTNTATPVISATGSPLATHTTYGSASPAPTSLSVSGSNIAGGILVTAPPGFEVSLSDTTGYAPSLNIVGSGNIPATTVYLRLAATTTAGFYSGNVVCSSSGAVTLDVPIPISEVRLKLLTITADNRTKAPGTTLVLGPGQSNFSSIGLVGSETIGSVTLTAAGTAANDAAGIYPITPSAATGGTFDSGNYDIVYVDGVLTVSSDTYSNWVDDFPVGTLNGVDEDPDQDGQPNGIENILGTSPDVPTPGLTHISTSGNTLVFRHTRSNTAAPDLAAGYEWSSNLVTWHASAVTEIETTVTIVAATITDTAAPANDLVEVTATVTGTSEPRIFVRLKAVK